MDRKLNAVRNIFWGGLQRILYSIIPFVTRTVLIKTLGADYLGLNGLFTSILGLLSLAELGISNAIISSLYKPIAEQDSETICALMAFYKKAYQCIGALIAALGVMLIPFLNKLINGDIPSDINIRVLYIVYLCNTVLSYFVFAYKNCLFVAHQRNDINSKVQMVCFLAQHISQILLLMCFKNYYCYVIVIPIITCSMNITIAYLAKKEYPEYACRGRLNDIIRNDIKKKVMGLMLGKVSSTIRSSIDSLFVSMFLGLTMVAMYTNYFYMATSVVGIIHVLESSITASVGNSIAVESIDKNHRDFLKFTFILQWIVGWCSICIVCIEQPFMKLWVGPDLMLRDEMALLCGLYVFFTCICLIRSIYTQALGLWWRLRHLSVIDIFVNIFLNYFLGKNLGTYGILAATIIDIVMVSIPWTTYYLYKDYFGLKGYWRYMLKYLEYFFVFAISCFATWFFCSAVEIENNMLKLLFNIISCILVPNILYFLIYSKTIVFYETSDFIKCILLRKK